MTSARAVGVTGSNVGGGVGIWRGAGGVSPRGCGSAGLKGDEGTADIGMMVACSWPQGRRGRCAREGHERGGRDMPWPGGTRGKLTVCVQVGGMQPPPTPGTI